MHRPGGFWNRALLTIATAETALPSDGNPFLQIQEGDQVVQRSIMQAIRLDIVQRTRRQFG